MTTTCKHENTRDEITAQALNIKCKDCKQIVHSRVRVLSSNVFAVARVGKDLEVQFLDKHKGPGPVGRYKKVPEKVYQAMWRDESIGSYIAREIKGSYEWKPNA